MDVRRQLEVCEGSAGRSAGKRSRSIGTSEHRKVGVSEHGRAESAWSRRGSNCTSNEMAVVRDAGGGWGWVDVRVHHLYITCTSLVHHSYIARTSLVHCLYVVSR